MKNTNTCVQSIWVSRFHKEAKPTDAQLAKRWYYVHA